MYGSAGTYSAGSAAISGHVRSASIGGGLLASAANGYEFGISPISVGLAESGRGAVFTEVVPIGAGLAVDADRIIGAITKSASIVVGLAESTEIGGYAFNITPISAGVSGGEPAFVLVTSGSIGSGLGIEADQVIGTLTFTVTEIGIGGSIETFTKDIQLTGIPRFILSRNGTTVDITVTNREGKRVKVRRADRHNRGFQEVAEMTSDTLQQTGLTASNDYKYKLAFFIDLDPEIIGTYSISKFTKGDG